MATTHAAQFREIPYDQLRPSRTAAQAHRRKAFDKKALAELAESIGTEGVIQPLVVRELAHPVNRNEYYEIVAGERRYVAAGIAKLATLPCVVRELTDEQAVKVQLIENLQREDLHPMHEAESYAELMKHGVTVDELYPEVGKSKAYVYGRLKLLSLSKACRAAFYAGDISASIAEKLARIPVEKLQDEALEAVLGNPHAKESYRRRPPMSFRDALEHINEHFMLDLSTAPFPVEDETLNGAGPCAKCPKRTGNQPELFGDVKKGDICTDTQCFGAKSRAWGQRQIEAAKKNGVQTITGKAASAILPYNGLERSRDPYLNDGWHAASGVRSRMKADSTTALVMDPKTGVTLEVVHDRELAKPKREKMYDGSSGDRGHRKAVARAAQETKIRIAIFKALRAKLKVPSKREIAVMVAASIGFEGWEQVRRLEAAEKGAKWNRFREPDYRSPSDQVARLKDSELDHFMAEAFVINELKASSYGKQKTPRLDAAAKSARVDVKKIRAELAPKKKPKAKTKKKGKRK